MRKGLFASVAALATGAGVAFGQGPPSAPPASLPGYPAWGPTGQPRTPPTAGDPNAFLGGAGGYPPASQPTDVPPAPDLPLSGEVPGPNCIHPMNPACPPKCGMDVGQIHKAAGGPDRWWFDVEENLWHVRPMPINYPLLTTGNIASAGIVGANSTFVLVGNDAIDYGDILSVLRINGGLWDKNRVWGVELSGFISEDKPEDFSFKTPALTTTVLARPVVNALTGQQTSLLIASPGNFPGSADVRFNIQIGGAEMSVLRNLLYCDMAKLNFLGGIRYVDLTEQMNISSTSALPNAVNPTSPINENIFDRFATHNQFLGGQFGLESELRCGRFYLDSTAKIAFGNMHERISIEGGTTSDSGGTQISSASGGLLAVSTNSFTTSRNPFAYVPEGTFNLGYNWTQRISTYIGFNVLYMSRVVRPADQIDPVVNPVSVPSSSQFGAGFGPQRPLNPMVGTDFWAYGGVLGLSIRY